MGKKQGLSVLLIEPDPTLASSLSDLLIGLGCQVTPLRNTQAATENASSIDIILCDMDTNPTDTFSLRRQCQEHNNLKHLPFIFNSTNCDQFQLELAYAQGAEAFLPKPCEKQTLAKQIDLFLSVRANRQQRKLTLAAMQEAERLRSLVEFLRQVQRCRNYADLAQSVLEFGLSQGFTLSFMIHHNDKHYFYSQYEKGAKSAAHEETLSQTWQRIYSLKTLESRIMQTTNHLLACFEHCSLFVEHAPKDDTTIDFLGFLMNSLESITQDLCKGDQVLLLSPSTLPLKKTGTDDAELF